jgi:hypothetical protein
MIVIWPIPITPGDLVGAAAGGTYPVWSDAVTYPADTRVSTPDGRLWQSPIETVKRPSLPIEYNLNQNPATQAGFLLPYGSVVTPAGYLRPNPTQRHFWWNSISVGAVEDLDSINEYKFLYAPIFDQTVNANVLSITLRPRYKFNSLALFGVDATSATVAYGTYTRTQTTEFASPIDPAMTKKPSLAFLNMPDYDPIQLQPVTITINNPGSTAKLGYLCAGIQNNLGLTLHGSSLSFVDYSHKERDTFGNLVIIKREYTDKVSFLIDVDTVAIAQTRRLLSQLRSTPAAYIARDGLLETLVYGFYQDFSMPIQSYNVSTMTLEVEGLV